MDTCVLVDAIDEKTHEWSDFNKIIGTCNRVVKAEEVYLIVNNFQLLYDYFVKHGRSLKENGFLEADIFNIPHCLSKLPSTISSFTLSISLFDPSHRVAFSPCVRYDMIRDCRTCNKLENWSKFEEKRISRC